MAGWVAGGKEEKDIIDAYTMIRETDEFVKKQLVKSESVASIIDIERRIMHDKPKQFTLRKDDRRLIIDSQFTQNGHKINFFLFNDSILVAKSKKNTQLRFKELRSLEVVQFEKGTEPTNFVIKTPSAVYKLTGRAQDCSKWVEFLTDYEESNKLNRTIGVHMDTILKRENPSKIPSIITQCIDQILHFEDGTKTEGLFRISGEHNQISALQCIFDQGLFIY